MKERSESVAFRIGSVSRILPVAGEVSTNEHCDPSLEILAEKSFKVRTLLPQVVRHVLFPTFGTVLMELILPSGPTISAV